MFDRFFDWVSKNPASQASDVVLIPAGMTFPIWHDYLKELSEWFSLAIPIVTFFLIVVKIYAVFRNEKID